MKQKIIKYKVESFFIIAAVLITVIGLTSYVLAVNVSRIYAVGIFQDMNGPDQFEAAPGSANVEMLNFGLTPSARRGATNTPVILGSLTLTNNGDSGQNRISPITRLALYEGDILLAETRAWQPRNKYVFRNLNLELPLRQERNFTIKGDISPSVRRNALQNGQTIRLDLANSSHFNAIAGDGLRANVLPPGRIPGGMNILGHTITVRVQ